MKYLLDVNALVALGNSAHADHTAAEQWLVQIQGKGDALASCAISELGFVRVSVQAGLLPSIAVARNVLAKLKASIGVEFLTDGLAMDRLPPYVKLPAQLTDGHLLELATSHGAQLATFDKGIPHSVVIR